jgi:OOP family OmpA-OmpF porin
LLPTWVLHLKPPLVLHKVIVGISLLFSTLGFGQNLINNPSFESFEICPRQLADFDAKNWTSPSSGTPDYYNNCCSKEHRASPKNEWNNLEPNHGRSYAGIVGYLKRNIGWREYLMTELKTPLKKGITYHLSFYVSLHQKCVFGIDELGVLFAERPLRSFGSEVLDTVPSVTVTDFDVLRSIKWNKVELTYTALGGEEYLIVGNFTKKNQRLLKANMDSDYFEAYYLFDSFELIGDDIDSPATEDITTTEKLTADQKFIFDNLQFETSKHNLVGDAHQELDRLAQLLQKHPEFNISIAGYTDNKGDAAFNKVLSEKRAQSVYSYLNKKGISTTRMKFSGHGSDAPITDNSTAEGRAKNRRVEVLIQQEIKTASGR